MQLYFNKMELDIAKCGCDCINCPTYKGNIKTAEERSKCSAGWEKYLDIKLSPEKLRPCDGCSIPDPERKTYYLNCIVRKCAIINGIDNCAYCTAFPCDELLEIHTIQKIISRENFINKTGKEISVSDYKIFIEPYAGIHHLKKIRQTLTKHDFIDYREFSVKDSFAPSVIISEEEQDSLMAIYSLLTTLCVERGISFARLQTLRNKRNQLLKILWTLAYYGVYNETTDSFDLDGRTFLSQKIISNYQTLIKYSQSLKQYDIHIKIDPLTEGGWLTPKGGLRKDGWNLRLSFGDSLMGISTLNLFKKYLNRLEIKYGNQAFRFLNAADLSVLKI